MKMITQADLHLTSTEAGIGFDEVPVGDGDYVPRDVPMTAARHAALAVCADMNIRFNIGEHVEEGDARNELVDELTEIIMKASGPGPFNINLALELNKQHRNAELNKEDYSIAYVAEDDLLRLSNTRDGQTNHIGTTGDALYEVLRDNIAARLEKK